MPERIDIGTEELNQLLERARERLSAEDYRKLKAAVDTLEYLTELVADKDTTIRHLRQLLLPAGTEKTKDVLAQVGGPLSSGRAERKPAGSPEQPQADPARGHGRNGAEAFTGARQVQISHPKLKHGDRCPECGQGNVYGQKDRKVLVRIVGQAPLAATVYWLERLRCGACGLIFTAQEPEGVGAEKFDETAAAMIAQLKYGSGTPFYRLEQLERHLGIPLPAATQWEIVEEAAEVIKPARDELVRQAAQGEVVHNDDTGMRVLRLLRDPSDERTGVFTSGIVATGQGRQIAVYFTGPKHAGENLADMLKRRSAQLGPVIQMCDALSRNVPKLPAGVEILLANCLAHGRRQIVAVAGNFPEQCRHVLESLGEVYGHDAEARQRGLQPGERLQFHQAHSGPVMEKLHQWLEAQFAERKTEPNSGLGKAITYLLRHWKALTLFLRKAGAPLDNNLVERALKRAVLHRKNALFYRTLHGAQVGDLFMTLIHTAELCGANSFVYLTELQRHAQELTARPAEWMPWNYRDTMARTGLSNPA
ncbi:MAG TPA: IS66 family transposase [Bryobacteraceae bacterium]|nr:IS66 family transposase [Bryobacteraceae bacterium]